MIQKRKSPRTAFSLIELSIVMLIISILISGILSVSKTSIRNAKEKTTRDRMIAINKAFSNYLAINRRLPCPAAPAKPITDSEFGKEIGSPGGCVSETGSGVINSGLADLSYGAIPTRELGLTSDMAVDGFDTKFSYIVDERFTLASTFSLNATTGFELFAGTPQGTKTISDIIDVREGSIDSASSATKIAVMLIISHGANKLGGWNAAATTKNASPTNADELGNTFTTTNTFDNKFVTNSTSTIFDDTLLFKTKAQLIVDAEMEFIMCPSSESNITSGVTALTFPNANYNNIIDSNGSCPGSTTPVNSSNASKASRICGKYGIWGTLISRCS